MLSAPKKWRKGCTVLHESRPEYCPRSQLAVVPNPPACEGESGIPNTGKGFSICDRYGRPRWRPHQEFSIWPPRVGGHRKWIYSGEPSRTVRHAGFIGKSQFTIEPSAALTRAETLIARTTETSCQETTQHGIEKRLGTFVDQYNRNVTSARSRSLD